MQALGRRAVVVAMSGGVDSSVTAMLMRQQGHHVIGVFMSNWDRADEAGSENLVCPTEQDFEDAQEVCERLGIRDLHRVSFQQQYWNSVFSPYLEGYSGGLVTPNPDVDCNRHIKFDVLRKYINENIGEYTIATGHYARLALLPRLGDIPNVPAENRYPELLNHFLPHRGSYLPRGSGAGAGGDIRLVDASSILRYDWTDSKVWASLRPALLTAQDDAKDQSYFLSTVREEHLRQYVFPLGNLRKTQVRAIASAPDSPLKGTRILAKKESMGVCFIGKRSLPEFLNNYMKPTIGRYIDIDTNTVLGSHKGLEFLTCGQRARISGISDRYFICKKVSPEDTGRESKTCHPSEVHPQFGDVLVCKGQEHPALYADYLLIPYKDMQFISPNMLKYICQRMESGKNINFYCKSRSYPKALRPCAVDFVSLQAPPQQDGAICTVDTSVILAAIRANVSDATIYHSAASIPADPRSNTMPRLPFSHIRVTYRDGPERAITAGQVCVLYKALEESSEDHNCRNGHQDIVAFNQDHEMNMENILARPDHSGPVSEERKLETLIVKDSEEEEEGLLLECVGGGKIGSAGPSYWDEGKKILTGIVSSPPPGGGGG